jgi:Flp pilus assembly protein TadG
MIIRRRRPTGRAGVTVVETAMVLSIVSLFILAIYEYSRVMMIRQMAANAVREGVRQAAAGTSTYATADIQKIVFDRLAGPQLLNKGGTAALQASDIQIYQADPSTGLAISGDSTWSNAPFGQAIAVKVEAQFKPMLPTLGFIPTSVPVKVIALARSEAN